jgi:hypothetical protein
MSTTFATDTPQNQAAVQTFVDGLRGFCVALRKLNVQYEALLAYWFNGNESGGGTPANIVAGYTAGSPIPNSGNTSWAGSQGVTSTTVQNVAGYLQAAQALNDTAHINNMVDLAGPSNV